MEDRLEASVRALVRAVSEGFAAVLGEQLEALAVFGSAADGTYLAGFSDLDLACFLREPLRLEDARRLHARLSGADTAPFDYLQVKYVDVTAPPSPQLVAGSFRAVLGGLDLAPYVHDDASLALVAADFLAGLPALLRDDVATWSVAVAPAHRRRHVRLVVTRVKPAVRAVLATHGTAPTTAYAADWAAMADALAHVDTGAGARLHALRAALPADDDAAGGFACELGLALLADVVRLS